MLKRNEIYYFLFRYDNNILYLLNGGRIKKMSVNSEKYYSERMVYYYYAVEGMFEKYVKALECISDYIKRIGGTGTIHGCIVDIDKAGWGKMGSHVYLNPYDGTLSFYSATSIKDKWFYESFGALLQEASPSLYSNYEKLVLEEGADPLDLKVNIVGNVIAEFVSDTSMYKPSRIIRSVQYMRESWVIRIWNDKVVEAYDDCNQNNEAGILPLLQQENKKRQSGSLIE